MQTVLMTWQNIFLNLRATSLRGMKTNTLFMYRKNAHWILGFPRGMVGPRTILVVRVYFEPTNERPQSPEAINVYNAEMVFLTAYLDKDYGFTFERAELAGTRTPTDFARAITEALDDFDVAARLMPEYATESKDNAEVRRVKL